MPESSEPSVSSREKDAVSSAVKQAKVFSTPELFHQILSWLTPATLAVLLRVQKGWTAPVAEVMYEEIHISRVARMSPAQVSLQRRFSYGERMRSDSGGRRAHGEERGVVDRLYWVKADTQPRRAVYCHSVRRLNLSPLWPPCSRTKVPPPALFDPDELFRKLKQWRKKFPHLQTISYRHPVSDQEDTYTVSLSGDKIQVEVETCVRLFHPWSFLRSPYPLLPPIPTPYYNHPPGLVIDHRIHFIMRGESWDGEPETNQDEVARHTAEWRRA